MSSLLVVMLWCSFYCYLYALDCPVGKLAGQKRSLEIEILFNHLSLQLLDFQSSSEHCQHDATFSVHGMCEDERREHEESVWSSMEREASQSSICAKSRSAIRSVQDVFDETVECYYNKEYDDSPGGVLARRGGGDNGTTEI